jgi:hypothetical protein
MGNERKWEALHAIDDEYFESLHVAEQSDGSGTYEVGGERGTSPSAEAAMKSADRRFRRLYPQHVCNRVCANWVLLGAVGRPDRLGAILLTLLLGSPALA